jgi:hypothetical protein
MGIELALSVWEAERLRLSRALTWPVRCTLVTVIDPSSPWLMARRSRSRRPGCSLPGRREWPRYHPGWLMSAAQGHRMYMMYTKYNCG